ncbi:TPA: Asp-tRNA(Asn)/Glu-tRNA(Gln) amidotransferase subunit GatB [Patescibacteria group bacterium]|nr:MAG: Aspartyl/glutamyl-tRNA(Asn/Gln) amidotransferase subunit B [Parcubacteria group bacterium GW2011_GWD2_42_14]HCC04822.1 Asp-tRNA(Asn)/Glu-tRNA(Gln) amidotransferase subunit GatB [Patescibacteria group bacterium]
MTTYLPTIGLEIHAELKTKSKMFCGCANNPDESHPNSFICPVCMAHPGTLPVVNEVAVEQVLRVGEAINGTIATFTEFDRKNYFYPDIPKNYQISQYKYPLISGGKIGDVTVTRIHLEEDTARSVHSAVGSKVDFNRAGVPLMELVTDPVIHDAKTAVSFAKELRLVLKYLDASDANLEKGEMRIEANISVAREGEVLGTKVEVKNLNSFKAVEQAIEFEIKRHLEMLKRGENIIQETRGWDENKQKTFSQRIKEESHDYRYYPDPDIPKFFLDEIPRFNKLVLQESLPQLPWELRKIYVEEGMKDQTVELLVGNQELNTLYQNVLKFLEKKEDSVLTANYLTSDIMGLLSKQNYTGKQIEDMDAKEFAELIGLISNKILSSRGAKDVLAIWVQEGGSPKAIAERINVIQISDDSELQLVITRIISENSLLVEEYKKGKDSVLQFLIGLGMKATRGAANPEKLTDLLRKELKS